MRSRLSIRCDLIADESVPSWISRLAACNRVSSAHEFCLDMGLTFNACVLGAPAALAKLGTLTETPLPALQRASFVRSGSDFLLRGERFKVISLRRKRVHVCPVCLQQGFKASEVSRDPPAYGRTLWQLAVIRTCPIHECALVPIRHSVRGEVHDFMQNVRDRHEDIARLAAHPTLQRPSSLETYVANRLEGRPTEAPWLDRLDLHTAIATCEVLGTSLTLGPSAQLKSLTEADLYRVGRDGFDVARNGESGIRAAFSEMQREARLNPPKRAGARSVFGAIYRTVTQRTRNTGIEPVRDLLRRHIIETTPVGPGDIVLGHPVEKRVVHSITTAARATGRHPKRLRTILATAGLIEADHTRLPSSQVTFDAERASEFLEDDIGGLGLTAIAALFATTNRQASILAREGFIRPHVEHLSKTKRRRQTFSRKEIDAFRNRLYQNARSVDEYNDPIYNLPEAAKRTKRNISDIIKLILNQRLEWVGADTRKRGLSSILVNLDEIKSMLHRNHDGIPVPDAVAVLGTSRAVVVALMKNEYLAHSVVTHQVTGLPQKLIEPKSLANFRETYVSFQEIQRSRRMYYGHLVLALRDIAPEIKRSAVGATYYRRSALPDHLR